MEEFPSDHPVVRLWDLFDWREFRAVAPLLTDGFVIVWPQSRERIVGRDNFIAINENYPGIWRCQIQSLIVSGNEAVSRTKVSDGEATVEALSFFTLRDGRIAAGREYWPDSYAAPEWRRRWVELY